MCLVSRTGILLATMLAFSAATHGQHYHASEPAGGL
jgi:hypothetical protein